MTETPKPPLEVSARQAADGEFGEFPVIDIRTRSERMIGVPLQSVVCAPSELFQRATGQSDTGPPGAYLICAAGIRSLELARRLRESGQGEFFSIRGGFRAWSEAGLPARYPDGFSARQAERYARHLVMPQVGPEGQARLMNSKVLLVGLGGLNSPAALYLAAAGVGTLGLVDDDEVELSNLQRQVIHSQRRVGEAKTDSAALRIAELDPDIVIRNFRQRVTRENAQSLVSGWDVVVDGTDSFDARYALNAVCVENGIPLVYGAVMRFQGQVSVFWPAAPDGSSPPAEPTACFECLMPEPPPPDDTPSCAEAGVLGVLPGIVGTLQATETLKILLGLGSTLTGRLLMFDALNMEFRKAGIRRRPDCACCGRPAGRP
jgi:molybdopterin/thiamine biosynthesis adenylyltransferase/rhodanese-related sulfurtransferase